jgi:hypothetical protein
VSEDFIEDDFNLTGLNAMVPFWKEAMEMVLDVEPGVTTSMSIVVSRLIYVQTRIPPRFPMSQLSKHLPNYSMGLYINATSLHAPDCRQW